jgi:hypothetical protein
MMLSHLLIHDERLGPTARSVLKYAWKPQKDDVSGTTEHSDAIQMPSEPQTAATSNLPPRAHPQGPAIQSP